MNEPIRILFQVDSLGIGGLEKKVTQLALRLCRKRFDVVVAYSQEWGAYGDELRQADIPVARIVPQGKSCPGVAKATQQIREVAPHIFHSFSRCQNANDTLVAHRAGVPVIISSRDNVRHWAPHGPARSWEFERNRMTHFVTPSCQAAANLCRKLEGIRPENICTIYNGVDLPLEGEGGPSIREELALAPDTFLIGYVSKYSNYKAHDILIRSVRKLADCGRKIHLVCCGKEEDGLRDQLQAKVADLSLEQHVTLLGPQLRLESFYRGIDIYVHPSNSEGCSMAILEAMSYGLPVIAASTGGTPEIVLEGVSGLLVPNRSPSELAKAVMRLMDRPEERKALGTAGRERVRDHFSVVQMVAGYEALYIRAMQPFLPQVTPLEFTGAIDSRELADTTIFVTTIGDTANFSDCIDHLRAQTVRCRIELIDRVAPMSAAFARMHELCTTPYYVQVDEDMILRPHAIEKLHGMITASPPNVALVCAPLWDLDVQKPILGVKIYRHDIVKQFPYENTMACDIMQLDRMYAAGYTAELIPLKPEDDSRCLGEHGKHYSPQTIFRRWQRHFHKHNRFGRHTSIEPWPWRLLERYIATRETLHLYALLGAISGIASNPESNLELDWRDINPALQRIRYYFPFCTDSES